MTTVESKTSIAPPKYKIDLNKPPRRRWDHIVRDFVPVYTDLLRYLEKEVTDEFGSWAHPLIETAFQAKINTCFSDFEYSEEIAGIAEFTGYYGLDVPALWMLNAGYDFLARCTAVAKEDSNGTPYLFRNLDWESEILRKLTIDVEFVRGERTLFQATTWVGFVGVLTGVVHPSRHADGYALALNFRYENKPLMEFVKSVYNLSWSVPLLLREAMTWSAHYGEVSKYLSTKPTIAPFYVTIVGTEKGQGQVITRSRKGTVGAELTLENAPGRTLVQTNLDHFVNHVDPAWAGKDPLLLSSLERRTAAQKLLAKHSGAAETFVEESFALLEQAPVFNEYTLYASVMCPKTSTIVTRLYVDDPAELASAIDPTSVEVLKSATANLTEAELRQLQADEEGEESIIESVVSPYEKKSN